MTVSNGSTLTLSPAPTVDGGDGYWIRVDGTLVANSANFLFSNTTDRRLSWRWIVDRDLCCNKGHAVLDQVTINNAKTAVKVDGHLTASKLIVEDAYIGINNIGNSDITTLTAEHIDYEVVRNSGSLNLSTGTFSDVAGGVWSTGTTSMNTVTISQAGTGIALFERLTSSIRD